MEAEQPPSSRSTTTRGSRVTCCGATGRTTGPCGPSWDRRCSRPCGRGSSAWPAGNSPAPRGRTSLAGAAERCVLAGSKCSVAP